VNSVGESKKTAIKFKTKFRLLTTFATSFSIVFPPKDSVTEIHRKRGNNYRNHNDKTTENRIPHAVSCIKKCFEKIKKIGGPTRQNSKIKRKNLLGELVSNWEHASAIEQQHIPKSSDGFM
jgi:hypothetical protein